jgi:light-regulated signal transduction histidine kinase (bacteriophytochrome)
MDLPIIVADTEAGSVALFPHDSEDSSADDALMRGCSAEICGKLANEGVRACLRIPFRSDGIEGEFRCDNRTPRDPSFEVHAAAELFAQLFAMQLQIDRLKDR